MKIRKSWFKREGRNRSADREIGPWNVVAFFNPVRCQNIILQKCSPLHRRTKQCDGVDGRTSSYHPQLCYGDPSRSLAFFSFHRLAEIWRKRTLSARQRTTLSWLCLLSFMKSLCKLPPWGNRQASLLRHLAILTSAKCQPLLIRNSVFQRW